MVAPPPKVIGDGVSEGTAEWFRALAKSYEGRAFFDVNGGCNGHGKQVWASIWSPYEIRCVDGREFMALHYHGKIMSVPEDASETLQRATDPSSFVIFLQFYRIEPVSNIMTSIGFNLDEATTAPDSSYNPENRDVTVTDIAGWKVNIPNQKKASECIITEEMLISSNSWSGGDLTKSLNVLFAVPEETQSKLAQLYQRPTAPDDTLDKKVELLQDFVINGKFFQAVDESASLLLS